MKLTEEELWIKFATAALSGMMSNTRNSYIDEEFLENAARVADVLVFEYKKRYHLK